MHHLNNSRSQRVLWLLEELGVDYEVTRYERDARTMLAPPTLRKVHPLGKSPVISEDGATVAESGAIVEYLLDRHDRGSALRPAPGTPERLRYTYWLHYAEGSAMPPLLLSLVFARLPQGNRGQSAVLEKCNLTPVSVSSLSPAPSRRWWSADCRQCPNRRC